MKRYLLLFLLLCASVAQAQTIADKLTTINSIKLDIKAALASKSQTVGDDFSVYDDAVASISEGIATSSVVFYWGGGSDWTVATVGASISFEDDQAALASSITDAADDNMARYNSSEIAKWPVLSGFRYPLTQGTPGATGTFSVGPVAAAETSAFNGSVNLPDGRIVFVPGNYDYVGIYNPYTNTYATGPAVISPAVSLSFIGGVLVPSGKVIFIPSRKGNIGIFDPYTNTYTNGDTVGDTYYAFSGGVLLQDGKVCCIPDYHDSVGIYDPVADDYVDGASLGVTTDGLFKGGTILKDGRVCFVPGSSRGDKVGLYDHSIASFTFGDTHGEGNLAFYGGVLMTSGKICFIPYNSDYIGIYDPDADEYTRGPSVGMDATDYKFSGGCLAPDGKIIFSPNSASVMGIYDPASGTLGDFDPGDTALCKGVGCHVAPTGKIIVTPTLSNNIGIYDNGYAPVPSDACVHPIYNKL